MLLCLPLITVNTIKITEQVGSRGKISDFGCMVRISGGHWLSLFSSFPSSEYWDSTLYKAITTVFWVLCSLFQNHLTLRIQCYWQRRLMRFYAAGVRFPRGTRDFIFSTASRSTPGFTQPPVQRILGARRPGREARHSPLYSAEINNGDLPPFLHIS